MENYEVSTQHGADMEGGSLIWVDVYPLCNVEDQDEHEDEGRSKEKLISV